jgi:hypothetical protein
MPYGRLKMREGSRCSKLTVQLTLIGQKTCITEWSARTVRPQIVGT